MNILLVIADLGLGGAQQVVINLANELTRQGHNVWVYDVFPELRKSGMIKKISPRVRLINNAYEKTSFFRSSLNSLLYRTGINKKYIKSYKNSKHKKSLKYVLKHNKIDAVNSHVFWADQFVLKELNEYHNRWWVTMHASYSAIIKSKNNSKLIKEIKEILNVSKGNIYVADEEKQEVENAINQKISTSVKIYNGLPLNNQIFNKKTINEFYILCASRSIKSKGWEELILAVKKMNDPTIKLVFAGDGPDLNYFKGIATDEYNIKFLGYRDDIDNLIRKSNVVILPSYTEKLPTIILEGLFANRPFISTDVGEIKNIISKRNGPCGYLIPASKNSNLTNHLVAAINDLRKSYEEYNNSEVFEEIRNEFSVEKMAEKYLNLFQGSKI